MIVSEEPIGLSEAIDINRYGTLSKLLRVTAYIYRFIINLKMRIAREEINGKKLKVEEIERSELEWVKEVQRTLQQQPDYNKFKEQLCVVERDGILVCQGRLEYAS